MKSPIRFGGVSVIRFGIISVCCCHPVSGWADPPAAKNSAGAAGKNSVAAVGAGSAAAVRFGSVESFGTGSSGTLGTGAEAGSRAMVGPAVAVRVPRTEIHPEKELLITDPAVVDSDRARYPGPWSFGAVLEKLVGKEKAPEAMAQLLNYYYLNSQPGQVLHPESPLRLAKEEEAAPEPPKRAELQRTPEPVRAQRYTGGSCGSFGNQPTALTAPGEIIPARPGILRKLILPWQVRDGYEARSGQPWRPNLAHAPFRLLAIVNRVDLAAPELAGVRAKVESQWKGVGRDVEFAQMVNLATNGQLPARGADAVTGFSYGGGALGAGGTFGEGRLIFGAVGPDGLPLEGGWTLIFEYKLEPLVKVGQRPNEKKEAPALTVQDWAQAWHFLGNYDLHSPEYADALEAVTRGFTDPAPDEKGEVKPEARPPLSQLRSNEAAFGPSREFRQFDLKDGVFVPAFLPFTPATAYMQDAREAGRFLGGFLKQIEPLIRAGIHSLPEAADDRGRVRPMLAGRAVIPEGAPDFHWAPTPQLKLDARYLFSINTCNGCHAGDTGCRDGMHVHPRAEGEAAVISSFLRMDGKANHIQDPGWKLRGIDQREMQDRAEILAALLEPKESHRLNDLQDLLRARLRRSD